MPQTLIVASYSPITKQPITAPFKIMSRHMANEILKIAGLPKAF
jgi:hypothetical protein